MERLAALEADNAELRAVVDDQVSVACYERVVRWWRRLHIIRRRCRESGDVRRAVQELRGCGVARRGMRWRRESQRLHMTIVD